MKSRGEVIFDKKSGKTKIRFHGKEIEFFKKEGQKTEEIPQQGDLVEFHLDRDAQGRERAKNVRVLARRLPSDTEPLLQNLEIDNYCLKLNKAASIYQDKFVYYVPKNKKRQQDEKNYFSANFTNIPLVSIAERLKSSLDAAGMIVTSLVFQSDWRLVVGLGGASVYETSMTLHHIYGFPYIPGSAVKGILRSWIISHYFDNDEQEALRDAGFCHLFGSPAASALGMQQGSVWFLDAIPIEEPVIQRDIMSPHYGSYYRKGNQGTAPRDDEHPVPVSFLTVENGKFQFIIASREEDNEEIKEGKFAEQSPLDVVIGHLPDALAEHGIGAKTSVGYGYMSPVT